MFADFDQQETVFVQKLASGNPVARSRALQKLREYIQKKTEDGGLTSESLNNLLKGLHYAMWMQDKPLLQEQLASDIASLLDIMKTHKEKSEFFKYHVQILSNNWHLIDRWRMDKFLMMVRVLLGKVFAVMKDKEWDMNVVTPYLKAFNDIICSESAIVESIRTHFVSVFLDELSKAGNLREDVTIRFIELFLAVLEENRASYFFFKAICDDIFDTLIFTACHEMRKADWDDNETSEDRDEIVRVLRIDNPFPLNFEEIADRLFKLGSQPTVNAKRREKLYLLSRKFKSIVEGKDPLEKPIEVSKKPAVTKAMKRKSAKNLLLHQTKLQKARIQFKKEMKELKKKQAQERLADMISSVVSAKKTKKSSNKFKPSVSKPKKVLRKSQVHEVSKGKISKAASKKPKK